VSHIARDHLAPQQAMGKGPAPRNEVQRRTDRDELVERVQRAYHRAREPPPCRDGQSSLVGDIGGSLVFVTRPNACATAECYGRVFGTVRCLGQSLDGDQFDVSDPRRLEWRSRNCHSSFQIRAVHYPSRRH
jgi:hypothetical protein